MRPFPQPGRGRLGSYSLSLDIPGHSLPSPASRLPLVEHKPKGSPNSVSGRPPTLARHMRGRAATLFKTTRMSSEQERYASYSSFGLVPAGGSEIAGVLVLWTRQVQAPAAWHEVVVKGFHQRVFSRHRRQSRHRRPRQAPVSAGTRAINPRRHCQAQERCSYPRAQEWRLGNKCRDGIRAESNTSTRPPEGWMVLCVWSCSHIACCFYKPAAPYPGPTSMVPTQELGREVNLDRDGHYGWCLSLLKARWLARNHFLRIVPSRQYQDHGDALPRGKLQRPVGTQCSTNTLCMRFQSWPASRRDSSTGIGGLPVKGQETPHLRQETALSGWGYMGRGHMGLGSSRNHLP